MSKKALTPKNPAGFAGFFTTAARRPTRERPVDELTPQQYGARLYLDGGTYADDEDDFRVCAAYHATRAKDYPGPANCPFADAAHVVAECPYCSGGGVSR